MSAEILATKLYIPPPRRKVVLRARLNERLNTALDGKLTLISAPAGFGKTTLVSEWCATQKTRIAWLSLDEGDNDPARFLTYFIASLQTLVPTLGQKLMVALQSPQPPSGTVLLTTLLNEIAAIPDDFVLVLDDFHVIEATPINEALSFLLEHLPPQMHMVIATREDPRLSLARLRVRDQLTELRVADLRFTLAEATRYLNQVMGLKLSAQDIAALEARTEGWIAGLQLACLALQGPDTAQSQKETSRFIESFTGSHHFVMDYLVEQVLQQQPASIQTFLLRTSILARMCGPLCDAVLLEPFSSGQETLEQLQRANLFLVPLDNERRWFRYHHLFADLLRQRLEQDTHSMTSDSALSAARVTVQELHQRASEWYEDNGLEIEAFHHAVAAEDVERAERVSAGKGIPLHFRGATSAILDWLGSLPTDVLKARPWLWVRDASLSLIVGKTFGVEEKLKSAEAVLQNAELNDMTRNLIGQIATARSTLALTRYDVPGMLTQSRRALEYLDAGNITGRGSAFWTMGYAYFSLGDRAAARRSYLEAISVSANQGHSGIFTTILATIGLGNIQEVENELRPAAETYRLVLQLAGDQPLQIIYEAHLGLGRILCEWNDLAAAEKHAHASIVLARQYENIIDRYIVCEVFLARVKLAQGDLDGAAELLASASREAREKNFVFRIPEVAAAQVRVLLEQGNVKAAAQLAQAHNLPISQARVHLVRGDPSAALGLLEPLGRQAEDRDWKDQRLQVMVLQALALDAHGDKENALDLLQTALAFAEPGDFVRTFLDEGPPMAQLLSKAAARGVTSNYSDKLLTAFAAEDTSQSAVRRPQSSLEPLSQRELQVLELIARGLSNQEISQRLFLALNTVKGYNRILFDKLQVKNRTEAVARAREAGLLQVPPSPYRK